jgi:hypothetical protein
MLLVLQGLWEQTFFAPASEPRQALHLASVIATAKSVIVCPTGSHINGVVAALPCPP